jgi:protein CsiD
MMKFAEKNARGGESRLMHLDDWEDFDRFANDPLGTTAASSMPASIMPPAA